LSPQNSPGVTLSWTGLLAGFRMMAPLSLFVGAFSLAFGVAAVQRGLDATEIMAITTLVFAGASQFAALEMWQEPLPVLPLLLSTLAINARFLLMSASLYPWLRDLRPAARYGCAVLLTDSNWAMSMTAYYRGENNAGILLGSGLALWVAWVIGGWIGVCFSSGITAPERFGLDVIMGCFLLTMLLSGRRDFPVLLPWSVAGLAALAAVWWLPPHTHVVVGGLAGGCASLLLPFRSDTQSAAEPAAEERRS
jgi:predicted branched-subunit amino acid permease